MTHRMPSSRFQAASHESLDATYAADIDAFIAVVSDSTVSADRVRAAFEEANNNLWHGLSQRSTDRTLDELKTINRTHETACIRLWQTVALWGTHQHYNKSWSVFAADHRAPPAICNVLTTKARDCGPRLRLLRCALSIQGEWGAGFYQRLGAVAPFPPEPKHSFLEQLAKLSRLQQLDDVVRLFPHFLTAHIARHTHSRSNQKRALAGARLVGLRDIEEFIAHGTATDSVRTTFREPALRRQTVANTPHPFPESSRHRESVVSIELPRRANQAQPADDDESSQGEGVTIYAESAMFSPHAGNSEQVDLSLDDSMELEAESSSAILDAQLTPPLTKRPNKMRKRTFSDVASNEMHHGSPKRGRREATLRSDSFADLRPSAWLTSQTLDWLLSRLAPSHELFQWYDVGNLDTPEARPARISEKKFAGCQNVLVRLCLNSHWFLLRFDLLNVRVYQYDSLRDHIPSFKKQQVVAAIGTAIWEAAGRDCIEHWGPTIVVDVPQQTNSFDCGVCTVVAALHITATIDFPSASGPRYTQLWRLLLQAVACDNGRNQAVVLFAELLNALESSSDNASGVLLLHQDLRTIQELLNKIHANVQERRQRQSDSAQQLATTIISHCKTLQVQHDILCKAGFNSEDLSKQTKTLKEVYHGQQERMQERLKVLENSSEAIQCIQHMVSQFTAQVNMRHERTPVAEPGYAEQILKQKIAIQNILTIAQKTVEEDQ